MAVTPEVNHELTTGQLARLLEVVGDNSKRRNWKWLVAWLGLRETPSKSFTENVILMYEKDEGWEQW